MTSAVIALVLLTGSPEQTGLPLSDPLNWWLYMMGTSSAGLLPGTLPLTGSDFPGPGSEIHGSLAGPEGSIRERSFPGGLMDLEGITLDISGTAAGEVLTLDGETETRCGATAGLYVNILPNLYLHEQLSLWTGSDEMPPDYFSPFHQGMEKGRHLYVDLGYLRWSNGTVAAGFGRIPQRWGPGRFTQLLLSDNGPPLDMLKFDLSLWDIIGFTGLTATVDSDSGTYLAAHRLDIFPTGNLRIGLSEAILFKSSGLEFAYMNPVVPWYPVQWNERDDDNAFMAVDASWKPIEGLEGYCELLIDDIQYENEGDRPNKLGLTAGVSAYLSPVSLGTVLEYTRIDRYVYSQRRPCNYYLHHGEIIGSGLGPDADRVTMSMGTAAAWPLLAEVTLDHTRHGEGTVQEGWPDSASTGGKFPSGTVEHSTGAGVHLGWYPLSELEVHGMASNRWFRNMDNIHGQSGTRFDAALELIYHW